MKEFTQRDAWFPDRSRKVRLRPNSGEKILVVAPHSEVCLRMRIAGLPMFIELLADARGHTSVQLYTVTDVPVAGTSTCARHYGRWLFCSPFSGPILPGEAGVYEDGQGHYCYLAYPPLD